ncbi:C6 zinc finger domain protein [Aspergillus arachidicola]|uniref:C6 zinc finger domain protein n=1 Tax=Aspergillus arachidicola TaxID=656916 RepID=A0A2G7G994_9EURO|nr:C6 zinc finger domain protein [Aspergillus arachidicola]
MNCPSRTDDTLLHVEWNQNPPFLAPDLTTRQDLNGISNARENKAGDGNGSDAGQSLACLSDKGRMNSLPIDPEKNIIWDNGASLTSKSGFEPIERDLPFEKRGTCAQGGVGGSEYNLPLHVGGLFIILSVSTLACAFPVLAIWFPRLRIPSSCLFFVSHFGTGVLIATAFVHLLPTAFQSLNNPCLSKFWTTDYPEMPGAIALAGVFLVTVIEMVFSPARHCCRGGTSLKGPRVDSTVCNERERPAGVEPLPHLRDMGPLIGRSSSISRAINQMGEDPERICRISSAPEVPQYRQEPKIEPVQEDVERSDDGHVMTPEQKHRKDVMQVVLLEMGILFHSVFIGMSLSVSVGSEFVILLIAIVFHQTFEGLALGSRIAALDWPEKAMQPWLMSLAYGCTTPIGQAIGLATHTLYSPDSEVGLLLVGVMNAISAGLLIFASLVELMSEDFLSDESWRVLRGKKRVYACIILFMATHVESPSRKVQLYYGSTSNFALMHEIYRDLVSHQTPGLEKPHGEVEEARASLDMFSFRRIFFGTPDEPKESTRSCKSMDMPVMFLPRELANLFLRRFLSTVYTLVPFRSKESFEQQLEHLYNPVPGARSETWGQCMLLLALAMGALGTEHYRWGDVLYDRVKATCGPLDDIVNLETVQHAHYQSEQGRPNSSFLHLGAASRKALSAGLHKEAPSQGGEPTDSVQERRLTFWSLYFYETWFCFHLGRPSSLSLRDVGIELPDSPFLCTLTYVSKIIARLADEMFGHHHDSLLQMWRLARSITDDYRPYEMQMQQAIGVTLDTCPQQGSLGVQQTILTTIYYHTVLLTFRPFLIFRGRWQQDMKGPSQHGSNRPTEAPAWLNEACNKALGASCRTIQFLSEAAVANEFVRELRYHGYFLGSASFAIIYDLIHGKDLAPTHLPWIYAALQSLSTMREGDPIKSTIDAIQTVLRKLNPAYEWVPPKAYNNTMGQQTTTARPYSADIPNPQTQSIPEPFLPRIPPQPLQTSNGLPILSEFQNNSLQAALNPPSGSLGSGEDLLDLTLSDMGWDFDFSTMDLETFFSIYPNGETPTG